MNWEAGSFIALPPRYSQFLIANGLAIATVLTFTTIMGRGNAWWHSLCFLDFRAVASCKGDSPPWGRRITMHPESLVALRCRISRSGCPSERVFRVTLAGGGEHLGAALSDYFFGEDQRPLPADQPAQRGTRVPGLVAARVIERKA
jgi:hypothetical protein